MHLLSHRHMHNLKKKVNLVFKVWHLYSYRAHKEISSRGSSQRAEQKWPGAGRAAPTPCRNWLCLLSMHLRRYTSSTIEDGQDRRTLQELATKNASRAREMKIQTRVSGFFCKKPRLNEARKLYGPTQSIDICSSLQLQLFYHLVVVCHHYHLPIFISWKQPIWGAITSSPKWDHFNDSSEWQSNGADSGC